MAFSSLFIGSTGLISHGQRMAVIGNNLANVNTSGYKRAETHFQTLISEQMACGSNRRGESAVHISQKGMGVGVAEVRTSFIQGSFEPSNTATDMAVAGHGFFGVVNPEDGNQYFTRSGVFRFDKQGYLLTPQGYRVQGGAVDRETGAVGSMEDIRLPFQEIDVNGETVPAVVSAPRATTSAVLNTNLDFATVDAHTDPSNPFFSMASAWNGLNEEPLTPAPGYETNLKVYDENGAAHNLTVRFDPVDTATVSNAAPANQYWEYVVTMPPSEDGSAAAGTSGAGLVGTGVLTFNKYGELTGQSAFSLTGGDPSVLSNWTPAAFNGDGVPTFNLQFNGAQAQEIGLDMGLSTSSASWAGGMPASAAEVGRNVANLGSMATPGKNAMATTNYELGSMTSAARQDGYAEGYLRALNVDEKGFVVGQFSNGKSEKLYQVGLYRFNSEYGLRREGSNLFSASPDSGDALAGFAGEEGRGSVYGNSLETSNADMADQFAKMIVTQRGFQSNTKVITTSDSILNTTIGIKR
ncbi:flagellar hook protein FlgE [Paucidesulfovibrio gracilis DSM 16080]|uniref:Flagellar hook protein FlgE n=1 Tax=Paucidesulfovibrio gracilis DSM 16080 TaxID=1121449 RepID=A0A1T4X8U2_9BACT|nr:flagellar hook-basal body complex protein [Paucidesulfovibrio gracilis]SKA85528.1 flagellar hook protein FlgE [Paucidesulfovibrio gracilis DSM 16080]